MIKGHFLISGKHHLTTNNYHLFTDPARALNTYNRTKRTEWCLFQVTSRPCPVAPAVGGQEESWGCTVTPRQTALPRGLLSPIVRWHRPSYHSMATGMLSNSLCQFQVRLFYSYLMLNSCSQWTKKISPKLQNDFWNILHCRSFINIFLTPCFLDFLVESTKWITR